MPIKNKKRCWCYTCAKSFHYLGIAKHRAKHRDNRERCEIWYTSGKNVVHDFRKWDKLNFGQKIKLLRV